MKYIKSLLYLLLPSLLLPGLNFMQAATITVQISNFAFTPASISIAAGDTVIWTNTASLTSHTSTSGTVVGGVGMPNGLWSSGTVVHNATFPFTFNGFAANTYPYFCSIHPTLMVGSVTVTNALMAPPSVSITSPANSSKFLAPADIILTANATQSGGTVTNVQFLSGATALGNDTSSPYSLAVNAVAAGNYSFSAVARNNQGTAATSAVVNVFVLTNAIVSNPTLINGQLQLTINGIAGQTYATELSSNLLNWSAFATNLAPANSFNVTDPSTTNASLRFYRARQNL
jgi:plastocyanin